MHLDRNVKMILEFQLTCYVIQYSTVLKQLETRKFVFLDMDLLVTLDKVTASLKYWQRDKFSELLKPFFRHKRVAFLDTDVGQPQFSPPGCLSLTILDRETNFGNFLKYLYNVTIIYFFKFTFSVLWMLTLFSDFWMSGALQIHKFCQKGNSIPSSLCFFYTQKFFAMIFNHKKCLIVIH